MCIRDLALFCGQLDISYTNFQISSPQDKAHFDFMAEELERAAQELSQFEGHWGAGGMSSFPFKFINRTA